MRGAVGVEAVNPAGARTRAAELHARLIVEEASALASIAEALSEENGDVDQAAVRLGIGRRTLYRLLNKYPVLKVAVDGFRKVRNG